MNESPGGSGGRDQGEKEPRPYLTAGRSGDDRAPTSHRSESQPRLRGAFSGIASRLLTDTRQTDYLALQVERLADAVEGLSERLRVVEDHQSRNDAIQQDRSERAIRWNWRETFWRFFAGSLLAIGAWMVKLIADHIAFKGVK